MPSFTLNLQKSTTIEVIYPIAHHDPNKIDQPDYHTAHMRNRLDIEAVRWFKLPAKVENTDYQPLDTSNYQEEINASRQYRFLDFEFLLDKDGKEPINTFKVWKTGQTQLTGSPELPVFTAALTSIYKMNSEPCYIAGPVDRGLRAINKKGWVPFTHWPVDHLADWNKLYLMPLTPKEYKRLFDAFKIYPKVKVDGVETDVTSSPYRFNLPPGTHTIEADWLTEPTTIQSFGEPDHFDSHALISQLKAQIAQLTLNQNLLAPIARLNPCSRQTRQNPARYNHRHRSYVTRSIQYI